MVTVIVNFPLPEGLSLEEFKSRMMQSVPRYEAMPGLIRKSYIVDGHRRVGGGAYTFESREAAQACFSQAFVEAVTAAYGKPDIRFFDTLIQVEGGARTVH